MSYTATINGQPMSVKLHEKLNKALFPVSIAEQHAKVNINATSGSMYRQPMIEDRKKIDEQMKALMIQRRVAKIRLIGLGQQVVRGFCICAASSFVNARNKRKNQK